jgi:hypothetical protein
MSPFTNSEVAYMTSERRLGRLATTSLGSLGERCAEWMCCVRFATGHPPTVAKVWSGSHRAAGGGASLIS